jgi:serine/alanine adding enzyme
MIRVEKFGGDESEWDGFAAAQNGFTHFHRLGWRDVMQRVFSHECIYLVARNDNGQLEGILPLVRVRSVVFGHYLVSMPFLNYGGPLGTPAGVGALVEMAVQIARRDGVKLLEMRSARQLDVSLSASHRKITVLLDLPDDSQTLFTGFDAKLRSQIRRPKKEGVTVSFGREQVDAFYQVFSRHMRDLGTPTQSRMLFREIANRFPEDCWFACAYLRGNPVAAGCGFRFGDQFEMTWASSLREYNRESPNMLLYWSCMERAIEHGVRVFNFGRCSPGSGTHRFKTQWGGRDQQLWWHQFAASHNAATPSPHDAAYSWAPRIWRRLPASLTTAVGPAIVRCIP